LGCSTVTDRLAEPFLVPTGAVPYVKQVDDGAPVMHEKEFAIVPA
jgi:hypothetical protein